jgi:hypothetical protein
MAHAYTPGLKVSEQTVLKKRRILPLKGDVLVSVNDQVTPDTVVAKTFLPGDVTPINVANILGAEPAEVPNAMLKKEGETVKKDELIAESKSFFGLFKSSVQAPHDGSIESISKVTGQVILRKEPMPVQVKAYVKGKIVGIVEHEGVELECKCAFVQGIFGVGGETHGLVAFACIEPSEVLDEKMVREDFKDKIVVGGSLVTAEAIKKLITAGARGLVTGGIDDIDLRAFLGYDIGVAITGTEDFGITIVVTEGFGNIRMSDKTFTLLKLHEGSEASINGATQIRAGVIRPEVIIPFEESDASAGVKKGFDHGLVEGTPVRIIREPYFGVLGKVLSLPSELQVLESGSKARVVEVEIEEGKQVIIPRANIEILED